MKQINEEIFREIRTGACVYDKKLKNYVDKHDYAYLPDCRCAELVKRVEKLEALVKEKVEETTLIYRSLKYWSIKARELENKETP